jgi:MFS transporter, DHA3 family, macrolide efflux protein
MNRQQRLTGLSGFAVVWFGQLLSVVGTRMTNFAVSIWVWDATGRATDFALLLFFAFGATVICSPFAGAIIDRWNRKLTLALSDVGSALTTAALLLMFLTDSVGIWQLYLVNFMTGAFLAFQIPVYSSTITLMVKKGQYPRANAMMFFVRSTPGLFAPAIAAALMAASSIEFVLLVDTLSYLIAIVTVLVVGIPKTPTGDGTPPARLWQDALYGFRYILRSRYFATFEAFLLIINIVASTGFVLLRPLVLERTDNSATAVGVVMTTGAVGGVVGAILLGTLKSPRDKMLRVLLGIVVFSVIGRIVYGVADSLVFMAVAICFVSFCIPIIDGYTNTIWQEKVEPHVQGRVFAARQFVEDLTVPVATVIAGPVVDHILVPFMQPGEAGAKVFGGLVGTGPGGAIGLVFVTVGVLGTLVAVAGFLMPGIRRLEFIIPDHAPSSDGDTETENTSSEPAVVGASAGPAKA